MKQIATWIVVSISLLLFFVACSKTEQKSSPRGSINRWMEANGKVKVLSTTAMIGDIVAKIGGDSIDQIVLITGEMDPHSYEIVKGDDEKIAYADLVFANGLMLEHSASIQYQLHQHAKSVFLGDVLLEKRAQDFIYIDGQVDPHIWMDISLWSEIIEPIAESLSNIDPERKDVYQARAKEIKEELLEKDQKLFEKLQKIPTEKRYLITSHDAFNYFGRRYLATPEERERGLWQERVKALQGLAPEEQISSIEIQSAVGHAIKHKISIIFYESNLSRDSLNKVVDACTKMGRPVALSEDALYGDTLGENSYLEMLEANANVIYEALAGSDANE